VAPEHLLHVYWTTLTDKGVSGHLHPRGKVSVDFSPPPDPPFTEAEMQEIALGAKMAAARVMRRRKTKASGK